jgi:two-component system LytT family response regulator
VKLRVVLVDDEDAALARLRQLCSEHADVRIVGEARTGTEAIATIGRLAPDLVLLDVQLGAMTGLDVLQALPRDDLPQVVFVTAYEHYAAPAFEHEAVDYLLKPCSPERFARALERVRLRIAGGFAAPLREELLAAWRALLAQGALGVAAPGSAPTVGSAPAGAPGSAAPHAATAPAAPNGLFVEDGGKFVFLDVAQIDYVEAARNYVVIHAGKASYCHRSAISALEQQLDPAQFARIHKSVIVNLQRIASVESDFNGAYVIRLTTGATCRSGPSYRARIQGWLRPAR